MKSVIIILRHNYQKESELYQHYFVQNKLKLIERLSSHSWKCTIFEWRVKIDRRPFKIFSYLVAILAIIMVNEILKLVMQSRNMDKYIWTFLNTRWVIIFANSVFQLLGNRVVEVIFLVGMPMISCKLKKILARWCKEVCDPYTRV